MAALRQRKTSRKATNDGCGAAKTWQQFYSIVVTFCSDIDDEMVLITFMHILDSRALDQPLNDDHDDVVDSNDND